MLSRAVVLAALVVACAGASTSAAAQDAGPGLRGVGVDERFDEPSILAQALDRLASAPRELPLFVRLRIDVARLQTAADSGDWSAWDDRLALYDSRGVRVLVVLEDLPSDPARAAAFRLTMQTMAARAGSRVTAYEIGAPAAASPAGVESYALFLKLAAVQIRAADPDARIAVRAVGPSEADWLARVYAQDTEAYIDTIVLDGSASDDGAAFDAVHAAIAAADPTASTIMAGVRLPSGADEAARRWFSLTLDRLGTPLSRMAFSTDVESLVGILRVASRIADVLSGDVVALDDPAASIRITAREQAVTASVPHRLLYNLTTLARYLVYRAPGVSGPLVISYQDREGHRPVRRDAPGDAVESIAGFSWDQASSRSTLTVPSSTATQLIDLDFTEARGPVDRGSVAGSTLPSVSEVVFREQQVRAAEAARYVNYTAFARLVQHFRPSPTDVFDVVTTNRFYVDHGVAEWEELSFSVNGSEWGPDRPAFPLLQAEKVLSLPLDVQLTADYRYTLEGTEDVDGRTCFRVRFDPVDTDKSLFRGRIWIDVETYQRVKVDTVQTRLVAPVVSSEETQWYEPVRTTQGVVVSLVTRVSTKQIFLIAGRNLLMEKEAVLSAFAIDPPDFDERRRAAHRSDRIMYRDTDQGVRYLTKRGDERVVSDRPTTSAKALAMGTTYDPTFDFPLPIFGLNYLDFDFLGQNSQLALLFGGVLLLGNVQFPALGQTPFDASVDVFAIAVPGNDLVFAPDEERRNERLLHVPFSTGLNLGYQFTPFQKATVNYSFGYDIYFADSDTAADFAVPVDTATHGVGAGYEYSRHGYTLGATTAAFRRASWAPWGRDAAEASSRDYRRYSVTVSKDFFPRPLHTVHVGGAWYGGRNLDRFSMYQFGLFDAVRMHGVPSAGVRFPELVLARLSYSFNVFDQFRIDVFLDEAAGRDPDNRDTWRHVTGTGAALSVRAPWRTMLRVDVGKSFLPRRYRAAGSYVLQVLMLKPL